jgi:glycosyltransferase involved in cell wall biosynthesis
MKDSKLYSIVIPVYGTSQSLVEIARRIKSVFQALPGRDYELIFVNDSSPNSETEPTLQRIFENDPKVTIVAFSKNFGQQAATLCGINHANGDFIITMDDDLQHSPEDIPLLIDNETHDVIIASFPQQKQTVFRQLASRAKGWFDYIILGKPKHIQLTAFRLIKRQIADGIKNCQTPYPFIPAMIFRITNDIVNVNVRHHSRLDGNSQYTLWKMIRIFSNLLINNSYLLLRTLATIGFIGFAFSLLYSIYIIAIYFFRGIGVSGWASLIISVVFFGGVILLGIGIIGEYLLRILANLEQQNMYFIKKVNKHD